MDGFCGTSVRTRSALGTQFGVNSVLVAFGDCSHRTFVNTSTASNTVVTNYVSHFVKLFNE
ncbi:hypothetical protein Barb4_02985 [Bacteroidales bacterium Barb4]|nr:hypothetical protein Barb4_02985 [Bacteroidales bacterium Barb4]